MSNENCFTLADWAEAKQENFDLSDDFEKEIGPLVNQLADKLNAIGMPFSMVFALSQDQEGTGVAHRAALCGPEKCPPVIMLASCVAEGQRPAGVVHHLKAAIVRDYINKEAVLEVPSVTH